MNKNKKIIIVHFLANGQEVNSVKGREIPLSDRTKSAYATLATPEKTRRQNHE